MNSRRPIPDQVFILRFWREETGAAEQGCWRVSVRNINTRRCDVVDSAAHAFAILTASLVEQTGVNEVDITQAPADETSDFLA